MRGEQGTETVSMAEGGSIPVRATHVLPRAVGAIAIVLAAGAATTSLSDQASAGTVGLNSGAGGRFSVSVVTLKEARFRTIIKQQYDFSCGSAAVASLLTYHYDTPTTEQDVFTKMWDVGDQEKIQQYGFSLLDMKNYLEANGFRADGFRITLDKLIEVGIPAITLINTHGYRHFVVVKGVGGGEVLLGDPALGVRIVDRDEFEGIWSGIAFVIRSKVSVGREYFNRDEEWAVRAKAPFGTALNRQGLASFTMNLTRGPGNF
jgi:predicted double-glycine peptidase